MRRSVLVVVAVIVGSVALLGCCGLRLVPAMPSHQISPCLSGPVAHIEEASYAPADLVVAAHVGVSVTVHARMVVPDAIQLDRATVEVERPDHDGTATDVSLVRVPFGPGQTRIAVTFTPTLIGQFPVIFTTAAHCGASGPNGHTNIYQIQSQGQIAIITVT